MDIPEIVSKIKKSRKYKDISEEAIKNQAEEYFKKNKNLDETSAIKEIKAKLHRAHGSFRFADKKLAEFLNKKEIKPILSFNRSTRERLEDYEDIYEKIFEITGKPSSILDLGCGLNPLSIIFMKIDPNLEYNAYDINTEEISFLNKFFCLFNIKGNALCLDSSNIENIKNLPSADLCFMFKLVDILEKEGHRYSEEIIKILIKKCGFIVVSFATKTISGKMMKFAERGWIERMLARMNLKFKKLDFSKDAGEIFYVISC